MADRDGRALTTGAPAEDSVFVHWDASPSTADAEKATLAEIRTALAVAPTNNATFTGTFTIPDGVLAIADTSGLQTALDAKAPTTSPTFTGTVTLPDGTVAAAKTTFSATDRLLGRSTAGAGNGQEIACTQLGRDIIAGSTEAAVRTTLSAASASDVTALQGPVNTTSGTTYTLVIGDAYGYRRFTSATAVALTVPTNASVAFATGTVITIRQAAAGAVTIGGASVTLNAPFGGTLVSAGSGATISLKKVATDTWDIIGQTTAA